MYYYGPKNSKVTVDPAVSVKFTMPSKAVHPALYCTAGLLESTSQSSYQARHWKMEYIESDRAKKFAGAEL